jgi:hypothetical protein
LPAHKPVDIYRRNLQKSYVQKLVTLLEPPVPSAQPNPFAAASSMSKTSDVLSVIKGHTKALAAEIRGALPAVQDSATRLHLQDVLERLNDALNPKK